MFSPNDSVFSKSKQAFTIKAARTGLVSSILSVCILICGCAAHYYRVTDPLTGKTYYTDDIKKIEGDGIQLKDGKTGETVIIQNSEVREINKYEYDSARLHSGQTATAGSGSSSYPGL